MKRFNVGGWRIAFISMIVISLIAVIAADSIGLIPIVPLAFLITFGIAALWMEAFLTFGLTYSIYNWIAQQAQRIAQAQQAAEKLKKPSGAVHNSDGVNNPNVVKGTIVNKDGK